MKKYLAAIWLAVTLVCFAFADYKYGQCQAIAKSTGKQCLIGVSRSGDRYCWHHLEEMADEAAAKLRERIEAVVIDYANAHGKSNVRVQKTEPVSGWSGRYCTSCTGNSGRFEVETKVSGEKIEVRSLTDRY